MNILNSICHPSRLLAGLWARVGQGVSDKTYLKLRYRLIFGEKLHLDQPTGYNEKINWLKIYNRDPLYPNLVDKAEVKAFVAPLIGEDRIIKTLGVWNNFNDIDFEKLPNQFVLKSTNGGGGTGVVICKDKASFNRSKAKERIESSMHFNWRYEREWVYKDIKPRIIAEEYMFNTDGSDLVDWKIHCFNGEPRVLFYASDRYSPGEKLKFDWYDMDLNHLPVKSKGYENANKRIEPFPEWEQMKDIARKLSKDLPYVRVDLYLINRRIYFGELTFFHDGGVVALEPMEWEKTFGSWIRLPNKRCSDN